MKTTKTVDLTTTEYGKLLGISRQAVLKKIKKGRLKTKKVGRINIITLKYPEYMGLLNNK